MKLNDIFILCGLISGLIFIMIGEIAVFWFVVYPIGLFTSLLYVFAVLTLDFAIMALVTL